MPERTSRIGLRWPCNTSRMPIRTPQAIDAYRKVLGGQSAHVEALINLGMLSTSKAISKCLGVLPTRGYRAAR